MLNENLAISDKEAVLAPEKDYFISHEKFELLKKYQQMIFDKTQVSPALRKLANAVITDESLEKVATKMIDSLS